MEKYVLAPYVSCGFYQDELDIGYGSILVTLKDKISQEAFLKTANFLKTPRTNDEILAFIDNQTDVPDKKEIYQHFIQNNFLIEANTYCPDERYSRDYLFYNLSGIDPHLAHTRLKQKHVVILGCGGIGNIIATNLATSGVGKLTLVDDDEIELSNLTRQIMFCEQDQGQQKTTTLKKALLARNQTLSINTIELLCDTPEKLKAVPDADLIIASGDSQHICHHLNHLSFTRHIPFLNVGYIQDIACWGPFIIPGKTACYACFSGQHIANHVHSFSSLLESINKNYKAPSYGAVNMMAAAAATLDIVKYLAAFGEIQSLHQRVGIWTHRLKIEYQPYTHHPECQLCKK